MRFTVSEKQEITHMVVRSEIGVNRILREIGLNKSTFYNWYNAYTEKGVEGLLPNKRCINRQWNSIPQQQKNLLVKLALDHPQLSSRELAYKITDEQQIFMSESSVYRILKLYVIKLIWTFTKKEFPKYLNLNHLNKTGISSKTLLKSCA